jgi:hypothetical protein
MHGTSQDIVCIQVHDCNWPFLVLILAQRNNRIPLTTVACRRQALPAIALGHIIISVVMVANGTIGARLHVPFPVLNRSSFGFYFSYFSVISRVVLSMFWFGKHRLRCMYNPTEECMQVSRLLPEANVFIR